MKNKEEPSTNSTRGSYGSLSRLGRTAAALAEQPALSLFPESLMEAVVNPANMQLAWQHVRSNRGAPGPDGITLREFPEWVAPRWPTIRQQLLDGAYRPEPVRRVTIDKPDGGARLLGIPNVLDRLVQQAILQVLTPVFDPGFSESSHGFRPKRSAHGAAKQVQQTIRRGHRFVVDMDLSKFFDRVQHDVLMSRISRKVSDKRLLKLIGRYLRAGVMVDGVFQPSAEGKGDYLIEWTLPPRTESGQAATETTSALNDDARESARSSASGRGSVCEAKIEVASPVHDARPGELIRLMTDNPGSITLG